MSTVILEWTFSAADYFEDTIEVQHPDYRLTISDGKVEAKIDGDVYDRTPSLSDALHSELDRRFLGVELGSRRAYVLSTPSMSRLHASGQRDGHVQAVAADAVLATHAAVAAKLRGGDWAGEEGKKHPTDDELSLVEPYLGVFERIFIAYQAGQVDAETLDQLYGYRLANIWANQRIVDVKLQNNSLKMSWSRLIALTYVVEAYRQRRFPLHTDTYFPANLFDRRSVRTIRH